MTDKLDAQRIFNNTKTRVQSLAEKCPRIYEHPKNPKKGIYMLYVDDFTDELVIPFYIGKGTSSGGAQNRYTTHLERIVDLNRLSGPYLEHIVIDTRLLDGTFAYLKIFKYMADRSLTLDRLGCVLLEECDSNTALAREQHWIKQLNAPFFGFNQLNSISTIRNLISMPKGYDYLEEVRNDVIMCESFWEYGFTRFNFRYSLKHSIDNDEAFSKNADYRIAVENIRKRDSLDYENSLLLRAIKQSEEADEESLGQIAAEKTRQARYFACEWAKKNTPDGLATSSEAIRALESASPDLHLTPSMRGASKELIKACKMIERYYSNTHVRSFCSEHNFIGRLNGYWQSIIESRRQQMRDDLMRSYGYDSYRSARLDIEGARLLDILPANRSYGPCPLGNRFRPFAFALPECDGTTLQLRLELSGNNPTMRKRQYPRQQEQILRVDYRVVSNDEETRVVKCGGAFIDCDINRHLSDEAIEYVLRIEFDEGVNIRATGFRTWLTHEGETPLSEASNSFLWRHSPHLRKKNWNDDGPEYTASFELSTGINRSALANEALIPLSNYLLPLLDEAKRERWSIEIVSNANSAAIEATLLNQLFGDNNSKHRITTDFLPCKMAIASSIPRNR